MIFNSTGGKVSSERGSGTINRSEVGKIKLKTDELITCETDSGTEFDIIREDFGYYVASSHHRLARHNLRPVLARAGDGRAFIMLVEIGHEDEFYTHCENESLTVASWLDDFMLLDQIQLFGQSKQGLSD